MTIIKTLINRMREPSSLAGVSTLAILFGVPAGASEAAVQIIAGLAALAAIYLPEGKRAA